MPLSTRHSLALLPVRIETRFGAGELRVRIFPDAIHVDSHEPELSPAERDALARWSESARDADAWRRLVTEVGGARAAYLVEVDREGERPADRSDAWTRAPELRMLPARWIVVVTPFRGAVAGPAVRAASAVVQPPLAVGPAPGADLDVDPDRVDLGPDARWLLDFEIAVARGMAVVVPLGGADGADHYTVVVYGLPADGDASAGAAGLAALLTAHRFSDGVAFLEAGTPTNHTDGEAPPWSSRELPAAATFAEQVGPPPARFGDGTAAAVLCAALGISAGVLARVPGARGSARTPGQPDADGGGWRAFDRDVAAMHALLWPATIGYFFEQMLDGAVPRDPALVGRVRKLFVESVRNRGPLPLVRVGRNPYGVLPVTSLARWRARPGDLLDERMIGVLQRLIATWRSSAERAPRLGADGDGAEHLARILGQAPVSTSYAARAVVGASYASYLHDFLRKPLDLSWWTRQLRVAQGGWLGANLPSATGRIGRAVLADTHVSLTAPIVEAVLGDAPPAYLGVLAAANLAALRATQELPGTTPLLYRLARHALLCGYLSAARQIQSARGEPIAFHDPEMIGIKSRGFGIITSQWRWLASAADGGGETIEQMLDRLRGDAPVLAYAEARRAIVRLAQLPARSLDPLVRETLDLCSHRADAWATAIATTRLARVRMAEGDGLYVGAYGWVERLRPTPLPATEPPPGETGPVHASVRDGGYIHAPSLSHATTGALLRHGFLAHRASASAPFAIDLSSARMARGRDVLDAVRAGASLDAALGRRFERALVEHRLAPLVPGFRQFASLHDDDRGAVAQVAAGLVIAQRRTQIPWGTHGLPAAGSPAQDAARLVVDDLADLVDAIADLAVAESVHQLAGGHADRAALLDALTQGEPPPAEFDVLEAERRGVGLEHRVMVLVPASATAGGWASTPRSLAEPALEAWCASLLGPASAYVAKIGWEPAGDAESIDVSLADIGVAALDAVYGAADLPARVLHHARGQRPQAEAIPRIVQRTDGRSLDDAIALAGALARTLGAARAATPADVAATGDPQWAELAQRLPDNVLHRAIELLESDPDTGLVRAWHHGVAGAVPAADPALWPAQAAAAATVLRARAAQLEAEPRPDPVRRLGLLVGGDLRIAPQFQLAAPHIDAALAAQPALVGDDPSTPAAWLGMVGRVRAGAGHLDRALLLADLYDARSDPALDLRVAQVPFVAGERWIGPVLARDAEGNPPRARTGLVIHAPLGVAGDTAVAGLVVDQWTESVPDARVTTGLSFQYDQPGAQAPQTILLAVPPDDAPDWSEAMIEEIVMETIGLVHARAVDIDAVRGAGHYLPALYFAINLAGDTASTDFFSDEREDQS